MKRLLLVSTLILSANVFAYSRLSDNRYFGGVFLSGVTKEITKDAYDFEKDLAVASDRLLSVEESKRDALTGLELAIRDHSYFYLKGIFEKTNLSGKFFDLDTIDKMSKEISEMIIEKDLYTVSKTIEIRKERKFLVVTKISKNEVEKISREEFRKRLFNVVQRLNDYYHELGE